MAAICPTVTPTDPHDYRQQIERIAHFTERLHLDFMDGKLAPTKSPPLQAVWWPVGVKADLHLMYQQPDQYLSIILEHQPHLVIIHAEAQGDFASFAQSLHGTNIKVGVALLAKTSPKVIESSLDMIDHVLIFSGDLGHFGGRANLALLEKVKHLKELKPELEIGWDGGVNVTNAKQLVEGGVDVLNVGGFIQRAEDPHTAYAKIKEVIDGVK